MDRPKRKAAEGRKIYTPQQAEHDGHDDTAESNVEDFEWSIQSVVPKDREAQDASDDEEPAPSSKRPRKAYSYSDSKKTRYLNAVPARTLTRIEMTKDAVVSGGYARENEPPLPTEIMNDPALRNISKFNQVKEYLRVTEQVERTHGAQAVEGGQDILSSWLASSPYQGRSFSHAVGKAPQDTSSWQIYLKDNSKSYTRVKGKGLKPQTLSIPDYITTDKDVAEEVGEKFCRMWERLPFPLPSGTEAKNYIRHAAKLTIKDCPIRMRNIGIEKARGSNIHKDGTSSPMVKGYFQYFDPSTGKRTDTSTSVTVGLVNPDIEIPDLPDHYLKTQDNITPPEGIDTIKFDKTVHLVRHMCILMHGTWGTKEAINARVELLHKKFLGNNEVRSRRGPYGGQALYVFNCAPDRMRLMDVTRAGSILPRIKISGMNRNRLKVVLESISQAWMRLGDIVKAWEIGCVTADCLNLGYISYLQEAAQGCSCDDQQRKTEVHTCDRCGSLDLCETLKWDENWGMRMCNDCSAKDTRPKDDPLHHNLSQHIRHEYKLLGLSRASAQEIADCYEDLKKSCYDEDSKSWVSAFTGSLLPDKVGAQVNKDVITPLQPSLDGIQPVYQSEAANEGARYHTRGNVKPVELCLNLLKYKYPAGVVRVVADWASSDQTTGDRNVLINKMNDIRLVTAKVPYAHRKRLGKKTSAAKIRSIQEEFCACKSRYKPSKQLREKLARYKQRDFPPPKKNWKPLETERLEMLIQEIETHFTDKGKSLKRSEDGCPFPFDCPMPDDWNWWNAWTLFTERYFRMWVYCNGAWTIVDDVETIYLECLWQFFEPTGKDPLRLPLDIFLGSPTRFVIAHAIHGRQMRTAWKEKPTSIKDRDPTRLNISVEAHISNCFKANYDETEYEVMTERVKQVALPKEMYDPDYVFSGEQATETDTTDDTDMEDKEDMDCEDDIEVGKPLYDAGEDLIEEG